MNHVEQATSPLAFGSLLSRFDFVLRSASNAATERVPQHDR
jgi:hypothetical protein